MRRRGYFGDLAGITRFVDGWTKRHYLIVGSFLVSLLIVVPLLLHKDAKFAGADEQAGALIGEINPEYQPWITPFWEPPSGEVASLLFALQAALGAGVLGYGLAYLKYQKRPC
jgi:cobalt/nickel transport protein